MHYSSLPTTNVTGNYSFRLNFPMAAGIIKISVNDSNWYVQIYQETIALDLTSLWKQE